MSYQLPFLPLEIQTSIAELRALGTPEYAVELLIDRIAKASEAKTTSLQRAIVEIEDNMEKRLQLIAKYLHIVVRIFQEKPLFVIPRGQPLTTAEDVSFPTTDGLNLRGCYLKSTRPRRG